MKIPMSSKNTKPKSTYEKEMENPKFGKLFEKEFAELIRSEIGLSKAVQDDACTNRLEALAGIQIGLDEVTDDKTSSAQSLFKRMRKKHSIPKRA
jgi:hypothetical protein